MSTLSLFNAQYILGLTRRVARDDGFDKVITAHIGPVIHTLREEVRECDLYFVPKSADVSEFRSGRHENPAKILTYITRDEEYLPGIADTALGLVRKGRKVIIFVEKLDQAELLVSHMEAQVPVGRIFGPSDEHSPDACVYVATYHKARRAPPIDRLDMAILATGRRSALASVSRILGQHQGKPTPVVYDYYFDNSDLSCKQAKLRLAEYEQAGYEVKNAPV